MTSNLLASMAVALTNGSIEIVDLTHTLSPGFPTIVLPPEFGQSSPVRIEEISRYNADGPTWYWNNVTLGEHTGTHLDAPIHWVTGRYLPGNAVDAMKVQAMMAPAWVIDCSAECAGDANFLLTRTHVEAWEKDHGRIQPGNWVLMRSDWSKLPPTQYANLQADGANTPGPNAEVMQWLVAERDILGFGTETIGTDAGLGGHFNPPYPAHHFLHGAGKYGLQCLTNLDLLPATGALLMTAPLKIENGSGSPLRVLGLVERANWRKDC